MEPNFTSPTPVQTPPAPQMPAAPMQWPVITAAVVLILAGGYAAYAYVSGSWPFTAPAATASPSPMPTGTVNPTAGLKTYTNTQYGFEFKYPQYLVVEQSGYSVGLGTPESLAQWKRECPNDSCMGSPYVFSLSISESTNNTLESYIKAQGSNSTRTRTTVAGRPAYAEVNDVESGYYFVTVENQSRIYTLTFWGNITLDPQEQQMLSTLRFTDTTAGWKTYINTTFGFQLTFTDAWKGYIANEQQITPGTYWRIDFNMKDSNTADYAPFSIAVYTRTHWQELQQQGSPVVNDPTIAQNSQYVFARVHPQYPPANPALKTLADNWVDVLSTFRFSK